MNHRNPSGRSAWEEAGATIISGRKGNLVYTYTSRKDKADRTFGMTVHFAKDRGYYTRAFIRQYDHKGNIISSWISGTVPLDATTRVAAWAQGRRHFKNWLASLVGQSLGLVKV